MPNQPKTPHRSFRINDDTYNELVRIAEEDGTTITAVVREALEKFINERTHD